MCRPPTVSPRGRSVPWEKYVDTWSLAHIAGEGSQVGEAGEQVDTPRWPRCRHRQADDDGERWSDP